jgi:hypothetical protein
MGRTALPKALALAALAALSAAACPPSPAQTPTTQQARKAQQNRSDAEAYLRREEAVATGTRNARTDRVNGDASVADEASGASAGGSALAGSAATPPQVSATDTPPAYGPVLNPRQPQSTDPVRRNPAEVHDEADTGANPAAQTQSQPQRQGQQRNNPQASRRHPAWQPAAEPMAPRPLRGSGGDERATAANPEPVPAPAAAPQPVVPTSRALNSCVGASCTDAAGTRYNGIGSGGNAGVSASGRLCNRTGATVQCF